MNDIMPLRRRTVYPHGVDAGYDVTAGEMVEAEKDFRAEKTKKSRLSVDELDAVAGGAVWQGEDMPDSHEMGCFTSYHHYDYQKDTGIWCQESYYCEQSHNKNKPAGDPG